MSSKIFIPISQLATIVGLSKYGSLTQIMLDFWIKSNPGLFVLIKFLNACESVIGSVSIKFLIFIGSLLPPIDLIINSNSLVLTGATPIPFQLFLIFSIVS